MSLLNDALYPTNSLKKMNDYCFSYDSVSINDSFTFPIIPITLITLQLLSHRAYRYLPFSHATFDIISFRNEKKHCQCIGKRLPLNWMLKRLTFYLRSFDTFANNTKLFLQIFYVKLRMILSKCGQFSAIVTIFVFSQKNIELGLHKNLC